MTTIEQIAINLIRFRKQAKLTQRKLALKSKVSEHTIIEIEKANYNPSVLILEKLSDSLGIEVSDLLL